MGVGTANAADDSGGTEFWLTFPQNYSQTPDLTLFITGSVNTTGTVEVPALGFSTPFSVTAGAVTSVTVPSGAQLVATDGVEVGKGIHVTAVDEVTVYGLNRIQFTTDAYLGLPTDILGTEYVTIGYTPLIASEFAVVGTQAGTTVTITPSTTLGARPAGVPYTVSLDEGDTYQLQASDDHTGTSITSDKPIAVFGADNCANVPTTSFACDHLVEQLPPTSAWGTNFVSMPLATRTGGDTFRIVAAQDGTVVTLNGASVATLGAGQFHEQIINGPAQITTDKPVLVAQYSNGSSFDGVTSDPFMMLIPPYEQFLTSYAVSTPASGFATNFVNVVTPTSAVGSVMLDGTAIPAASFTAIGTTNFSGAQLPVALGSHSLSGPLPFGVHSYGFDSYDSYGYPGGMSLSSVAVVAGISLTPKTDTPVVGTSACVTAAVEDSNGDPVSGIRVDFDVTGVNPNTGFATTDAAGTATYCYTGATPGVDSIVGTVSLLSDTASKDWQPMVVDNNPPVFVTPTPNNGDIITVNLGDPADFSVAATDPDTGDIVTTNIVGVPVGATYVQTPGNPGTGDFAWTPTATGQTILTLQATDQDGLSANQRTVTINVVEVSDTPCSGPGHRVTIDDWDDHKIVRRGQRTPKAAITLPSGLYDIELVSSDPGHAPGVETDQTSEEWLLEVYQVRPGRSDRRVYRSPEIHDLADADTILAELVGTGIQLGGDLKVLAKHSGARRGNNSIIPLCANFLPSD